jgi:hypothetical protein
MHGVIKPVAVHPQQSGMRQAGDLENEFVRVQQPGVKSRQIFG